MTGNVTQIKREEPVRLPHFVETPSSRAMLLALRRARARSRLTMIIGGSGVGKSRTMWKFKTEARDTLVSEARAQEGGAWNLAYRLCELLDMPEPNSRNMPKTGHEIAEEIGPGGFVIIDEAQYLVQENARGPDNWGAVEWFRGVAEAGHFGAAFIGDKRLANSFKDAAQLPRRTGAREIRIHLVDRSRKPACVHAR
ncbi:AAA family ATPase [Primorskyibacter sp. 2E233]|uniref:AAA family ATPase n=1 Tax=Primorskyibacter sp. 2E233 TaxID=3413431 RepID=UPI003BF37EFA